MKELNEEEFRRLTGVKKSTFNKMVGILCEENKKRKPKEEELNEESMLLMILEYLREYRTYFHISQSYGVSESTAYKTVKWVEIQHPDFALPGRKELLKSDMEYSD